MPKKISTDPRSRIIRKEMADSSGRSGYGRKQSGSPVWEIRRALRKRRAARRVCGEPAHPEDASVREIAEALVGIGEKSAPAVFGFVGCVTVVPVAIRVHFFADGMRRNPVIHPVGVDRIRGEFSAVKRAEQIAGIPADQHADVRTGAVELQPEEIRAFMHAVHTVGVLPVDEIRGDIPFIGTVFSVFEAPKADPDIVPGIVVPENLGIASETGILCLR